MFCVICMTFYFSSFSIAYINMYSGPITEFTEMGKETKSWWKMLCFYIYSINVLFNILLHLDYYIVYHDSNNTM